MQGETGFGDILALVRDLRVRCDFDRALTLDTLRPYFREEIAEYEDALDDGDERKIMGELGDLLLHLAFQVLLAEERKAFTLDACARMLIDKMKARHPHLYADGPKPDWEKQKLKERKGALGHISSGLPELERAYRYQERAAAVGFDWPDVEGPLAKLAEEVDEAHEEPVEEIGDVLFAAVNVARKAGIHPTIALRQATEKFVRRFTRVEELAGGRELSLEELDKLWDDVKASE
jgi:MazG family protein